METVLDETKEAVDRDVAMIESWKEAKAIESGLKIALLEQEVRGLKAMLNQYKRDYKKLLEKEV